MNILTPERLDFMCGGAANAENVTSFCAGLNKFGRTNGLHLPHRLAQYIGQMMHESARFKYDHELWGPTPAQKRYDTRTDLGNTPDADGDGYTYRGRTAIQITGKSNYKQFTAWARKLDKDAPDFVAQPGAANTDPWEGLGPIWYWDTRNLNDKADSGDRRGITKKINGGYNGMADRDVCIDRASLVLMGYEPTGIRKFQSENGLVADGVSGKMTRAKMHELLKAAGEVSSKKTTIPPITKKTVASAGVLGFFVALAAALAKLFGG